MFFVFSTTYFVFASDFVALFLTTTKNAHNIQFTRNNKKKRPELIQIDKESKQKKIELKDFKMDFLESMLLALCDDHHI